jgi:hypothetical protein
VLYFTDWHTWALQVQLFFPTSSSSPPYPPLPRLQKLHNEKRVKKRLKKKRMDAAGFFFFLSLTTDAFGTNRLMIMMNTRRKLVGGFKEIMQSKTNVVVFYN